jgi:hypothetical protein
MAQNYNIRRSATIYSEKVEDASQRLKTSIEKNNFLAVDRIESLMLELNQLNTTHLTAAIDRAENSCLALQALLDVLKNEKKRKEVISKVNTILNLFSGLININHLLHDILNFCAKNYFYKIMH